jgi:Flp pilus assembly protein TadB
MKRLAALLLVTGALGLLPAAARAQEGISQKKQERILAKKAKEEKKQKAKQEKADRAHHLALQDKATQKRIKRHTRRADRHGSGAHRDGPLRKLFRRKR